MFLSKIRKPSEWKTVKTKEVQAAVKDAKESLPPAWCDVEGWSFSPRDIHNIGPQKKRRRLFTGAINPSEFFNQAQESRKQKVFWIGIGLFVLLDLVLILVLLYNI